MAQVYETPAVLLRQIDLPEADRIGVFYTYEYGKYPLLLKGIKKAQSKLQYCIRDGAWVDIEFVLGRQTARLTSIHEVDLFADLAWDRRLSELQGFWLFFLDYMTEDEDRDKKLFHTLVDGLYYIREYGEQCPEVVKSWLVVRGMVLLGYGVDLVQCVISQNSRSRQFFLSIKYGGLVAEEVECDDPDCFPVNEQDILTLRRWQKGEFVLYQFPPSLVTCYLGWYGIEEN